MNTTRNNLPAAAREELIPLLNARLADASDLKSQPGDWPFQRLI